MNDDDRIAYLAGQSGADVDPARTRRAGRPSGAARRSLCLGRTGPGPRGPGRRFCGGGPRGRGRWSWQRAPSTPTLADSCRRWIGCRRCNRRCAGYRRGWER